MTGADPDDMLRTAVSASLAKETSARQVEEKQAELTAAYLKHRRAIQDRLVAAGERVIELLVAAAGQGGIRRVVVEERSFGRTRSMDGWMLKALYNDQGGDLLLPSGDVVQHSCVRGGRLSCRDPVD